MLEKIQDSFQNAENAIWMSRNCQGQWGCFRDARTRDSWVAAQFGVSHSVISRAWTRYQQTGRVNRRHVGGRHRATTAAQDRYLITSAARNRFSNATRLQRNLREASGTTISTQTVRNRLHDAGFRARRPAVKVPLIWRHQRERLQWCQLSRLCGLDSS